MTQYPEIILNILMTIVVLWIAAYIAIDIYKKITNIKKDK